MDLPSPASLTQTTLGNRIDIFHEDMKTFFLFRLWATGLLFTTTWAQNAFPLDPLSADEIQQAVNIIQRRIPATRQNELWTFRSVELLEPPKIELLSSFLNDSPVPPNIARKSRVLLGDNQNSTVYVATVDLTAQSLESLRSLNNSFNSGFTPEEMEYCVEIAQNDTRVQERCREMGWTNASLIVGDCWSLAYTKDKPEFDNATKPAQAYIYGQLFPEDNHFSHPFDFCVNVDIATKTLLSIVDLPTRDDFDNSNRTGNVVPTKNYNYRPELNPEIKLRKVNHIQFSQPDGAGYTIRGNEISWQNFTFRIGFTNHEGLVVHHVAFQDGNERRPLFYRLSVGELFVPYGDPRPPYYQKFIFDMGEFKLGPHAVDLQESRLCTGGGVPSYFSFNLNDQHGNPVPYPNVICIHEEDTGILWAHSTREGRIVHTRSQRLSVSALITLDNYDYKFSWHFYQDARLEFATELHGILSSQLMAQNLTNTGGFGTRVAPDINAQYHQHHVAVRIDPELDGNQNSVSMVDIVAHPDATGSNGNPYGNAFVTQTTPLRTQAEARTRINGETGRTWVMSNPNRIHPYTGKPVGWKLLPFNAPPVFARKDSPAHDRFAWTDYNVWVTKYDEGHRYPEGEFNEDGKGLPEWVDEKPNQSVENEDVVVWYVYGFTHIPRVEDWPIMPQETAGFAIKPTNFFLQNPALNVPAPP